MAIRETLQIGHPLLKAENQPVIDVNSKKIKQIINDLIDTMRNEDLIGMSAPQIGENYRIFITELRPTKFRSIDQSDQLRIYINPQIIYLSEKQTLLYEGCGSVLNANLFGPVIRPKEIIINATGNNGKKFQLKCDGLLARVIQHENDHLNGIEFTEKISDYKQLLSREFYIQNVKNSFNQLENSRITIKEIKS